MDVLIASRIAGDPENINAITVRPYYE